MPQLDLELAASFSETEHETIETVDREEVVHDLHRVGTSHSSYEYETEQHGDGIITITATGETNREVTIEQSLALKEVTGSHSSSASAVMHVTGPSINFTQTSGSSASETYGFHRNLPGPAVYVLDEYDAEFTNSVVTTDEDGEELNSMESRTTYDETNGSPNYSTAHTLPRGFPLPEVLDTPLSVFYCAGPGLPVAGTPQTASGPLESGGHWERTDNGLNWSYQECDASGNLTFSEAGRWKAPAIY